MSAETINSEVDAARAAMKAGNWATAKAYLMSAKALMAAKPDTRNGQSFELRWDRAAIDSLIAECQKELSSSSGVGASGGALQFQKIRIVRDSEADY